ncbi:MAG TPA: MFS transporter [Streptosporangiaceae bacterium]
MPEPEKKPAGNRSKFESPPPATARPGGPPGRLGLLAERDFAVFYAGYVTSLIGSTMSRVALTFAVLGSGGSAADLGYVSAASVVPLVIFMLGGGVIADRIGRRRVMLGADAGRFLVQAGLAATLFLGRPPVWLFVAQAGLLGTAQAFFGPALSGLTPEIAPAARLADANALLGVAQSIAQVTGPALAGVLVAVTGPATVIAADAGSFGASLAALALLRIPPAAAASDRSPWRDLAQGWAEFRAHPWLQVTTIQFALFNLLTWAPFLLLTPILARAYLGGARGYGVIQASLAVGAIVAGLLLVGRRPRRPLVTAVIGSFGYAAPCLALAVHAPLAAVAAAAALAGAGSATFVTFSATVTQQRVPAGMLSRVTAIELTGAYALGAGGFAVIGPVADAVGAASVLALAAAYSTLSSAVVLALPAIRAVRWPDPADSPGFSAEYRSRS